MYIGVCVCVSCVCVCVWGGEGGEGVHVHCGACIVGYWISQGSLEEYSNKHSAAEKLVLTSLYWVNMCSRWYTPDLPVGTTDICLYQGIKVCIPLQQKSVPSACSQQVTACFRSVFIVNCLPHRYFLRGQNRWKLLGATLQPGLVNGCSTTGGRLWHTLTTILVSFIVISISLNCIRIMWVASDL